MSKRHCRGHSVNFLKFLFFALVSLSGAWKSAPNPKPPSPLYNVTDTFRGKWIMSTGENLPLAEWGVSEGELEMDLHVAPIRDLTLLHFATGSISIRSGPYLRSKSIEYTFQGVYVWESATLFFIAIPKPPDDDGDGILEDYSIDLTDILNASFINSDLSAATDENPYINSENFRFLKQNSWRNPSQQKHSKLEELNQSNVSTNGSVNGEDFPGINVRDKCILKGVLKFDPNVDQSRRAYPSYYGDFAIRRPLHALEGQITTLHPKPYPTRNPHSELTEDPQPQIHPAPETEPGSQTLTPNLTEQQPSSRGPSLTLNPYCPHNLTMVIRAESVFSEKVYRKVAFYLVLYFGLALLEIYFFTLQLDRFTTMSDLSKVSPHMIGAMAVFDCYISVAHLSSGFNTSQRETLSNLYFAVAFVKFALFSMFELRYLIELWKAFAPDGYNRGEEEARRQTLWLYLRFYAALLIGMFIAYVSLDLGIFDMAVVLIYSYWWPQIIHSIIGGAKKPLDLRFVFGQTLCRLFLPIYFGGCPENVARIETSFDFILKIVLWQIVQVGILVAQHVIGPYALVPHFLRRKPYDYHRLVQRGDGDSIQCTICQEDVSLDDVKEVMTAPCEHTFHSRCLIPWMDHKLQCPTCRRPLPPLPEPD